jgi:thiamine biosynthesis protein ThiS
VTIQLNGELREIADGMTVRALLAEMKLSPEKVAVELNRRLLRGERYDTVLSPNDAIEIVTFVGGG